MDIDLEVFVNRSTAPELNSGQQQLEDILILHLERGKDFFISISGSYLPSCFGSSIHTLCQLREPIQDMSLETIRKLVSSTNFFFFFFSFTFHIDRTPTPLTPCKIYTFFFA